MELVTLGESIEFKQTFSDDEGILIDPPDVSFRVYRIPELPTFGPYSYSDGTIAKTGVGMYEVVVNTHISMMPGIYTAEWNAVIEGDAVYEREEFQITEESPSPSTLLDPHIIYGIMRPSPLFNDMGIGLTSQLCIVGHCSGLSINDPFQVDNIQEAINLIGANQYSPMVRYLLEAYNAGARDIWLVASAPEREYVQWDPNDPSQRFVPRAEFDGKNFYEQYEERYIETMDVLAGHTFPDIVVAPDAPLYNTGGIDFLTPLVNSSVDGFLNTKRFRFGFIGTLMGVNIIEADLDAIENDARLDSFGEDGKTIGVFMGEGTINTPNVANAYAHSCVNIAAATAATAPFESGICNRQLKGLVSPIGKELSKDRIRSLANKKINPLIRTTKAKRGAPYNSIMASDNLLAADDSDFWALPQMRIVQEVLKVVVALSERRIGTIKLREYKRDVTDYLTSLVVSNKIRSYDLFIDRNIEDLYALNVEITIKPYIGVREIFFAVEVGAGSAIDNPLRNTV